MMEEKIKCYLCGKEIKTEGVPVIVFEDSFVTEEYVCENCKYKVNECPCGGTYYLNEGDEGDPLFTCEDRLRMAEAILKDYLEGRLEEAPTPSFEGAIKLIFFLARQCFCSSQRRRWDWAGEVAKNLVSTFSWYLEGAVSKSLRFEKFEVEKDFFVALVDFLKSLK
jgi:hypothetical protein